MLFVEYPKCSTCQKAKKWLDEHGLTYEDRHIVENNPTYEELKDWYARSGLPLKRFFNTSGLKYKALQLKDKLPTMSEDEQLKLLATDGMLVKRPVIVMEDKVLTGFKPAEWEEKLRLAEEAEREGEAEAVEEELIEPIGYRGVRQRRAHVSHVQRRG